MSPLQPEQVKQQRAKAQAFIKECKGMTKVSLDEFIAKHFTKEREGVEFKPVLPVMDYVGRDGKTQKGGSKSNLTLDQYYKYFTTGKVVGAAKGGKDWVSTVTPREQEYWELRPVFGNKQMAVIDVDGLHDIALPSIEDVFKSGVLPEQLYSASFFLSRQKHLPHFIFYISNLPENIKVGQYVDVFKGFNGDFLLNHVWERCDHSIYQLYNYGDDLITIDWEDIKGFLKPDSKWAEGVPAKPAQTSPVSESKPIKASTAPCMRVTNEALQQLIDIVDLKYINDRAIWLKLIWAIRSEGEEYREYALNLTKRSPLFKDETYFDRHWNGYKPSSLTVGTLNYYAKLSNPEEYKKIITNACVFYIRQVTANGCTHLDVAECFYQLYKDEFLYTEEKLYYFNGIHWKKQEKLNIDLHKKFTLDFLKVFIEQKKAVVDELVKLEPKTPEHDVLSAHEVRISKAIFELKDARFYKSCVEHIVPKFYKERVDFEFNSMAFCFNNCVFDLATGQRVVANREDYMVLTTGYDYRQSTPEERAVWMRHLERIFPMPDERDLYMVLLATGLHGQTLEKFILANGGGRNGKGAVNEQALAVFGDYGITCKNDLLVSDLKVGACQEVANMNYKRFCIYREPNEDKALNSSTIKEITGGSEIQARGLYSTNTKVNLRGTHILECNTRQKMSGDANEAIIERTIDILFRSYFTKDLTKINEAEFIFMADDQIKTKEFQETHKFAMFDILLGYLRKYQEQKCNIQAFVPAFVRDRSIRYIQNSNSIYAWLEETYEKTSDDTDVVKIADIYERYKCSELYNLLDKKAKRQQNQTWFLDNLSKNVFLRRYYVECDRRKAILTKYNVTKIHNVLTNWKEKEAEPTVETE